MCDIHLTKYMYVILGMRAFEYTNICEHTI